VACRREFYDVYHLTCDICGSYTFSTATSWGICHILSPSCLMIVYKFTIQNSITWWHIRVQLKWLPLIWECTNFRYQVVQLTKYFMVVSSICGYSTQYGSCFMSPLYCLEFWGPSYIFKKFLDLCTANIYIVILSLTV